jgi:hypothetical protein
MEYQNDMQNILNQLNDYIAKHDIDNKKVLDAYNAIYKLIPNANTTATASNGASTIVARDTNGSFSANVGTFITLSGAGGSITAINASNISAGTIDNARTTAASANGASTIVARDGSGNFSANVITANGSALTALNASSISSGTVPTARLGSGTANNTTFLRGDQTYAVVSGGTLIPAGTVMIFGQTSAPTGFTKLTDQDNAALRVVSGTASTGGSVNFTTAFVSQTPTGSISVNTSGLSAGATTLSTSQIPSHNHLMGGSCGPDSIAKILDVAGVANGPSTANTGGGGSHTHSISGSATATFTGTAINLAVKYVDVIRATKD